METRKDGTRGEEVKDHFNVIRIGSTSCSNTAFVILPEREKFDKSVRLG